VKRCQKRGKFGQGRETVPETRQVRAGACWRRVANGQCSS
jgi:hypothetical protein